MNKFSKILLVCLLALSCGFVGGYAGNKFYQNNQTATVRENNNLIATSTSAEKVTYSVEKSSLKEAIEKAYPSVVEITSKITSTDFFYRTTTGLSLGSGVIISSDGYIITNNHVIQNATAVTVKTSDGQEYDATLVGTDSKSDIALIKIDAENLTYATIADSDAVELGDSTIVIGNPLGEGITVTDGIISATDKEITINNETMYVFQTNAAVNEGNSGGGLFNANGELIGIVNAKSSSSDNVTVEGLGYAIPSNTVIKISEDLKNNGYVKNRATLGVRLYDFTSYNPYNLEAGLYITEIEENSAAEKAGLQKYDRIISFDGEEINSYAQLSAAMLKHNVGDKVEIKVVRTSGSKNQEMTFEVTLQEASNS